MSPDDPDRLPSIYHKMIWEFPFSRPTHCRPNPMVEPPHKPFYLCIASILPQTSVFRFVSDEDRLINMVIDKETSQQARPQGNVIRVPTKKDYIGYQKLAPGDSGSPHWMYNPAKKKRALVGITSHGRRSDDMIGSHIMITTHPTILQWIKRHSGI